MIDLSSNSKKTKQDIIKELKGKKQIVAIFHCLDYVKYHRESFLEFGIGWFDFNKIIINTRIVSNLTGRKDNTINRNFSSHGFRSSRTTYEIRRKICEIYNINELPDPSKWILRSCKYFNQLSTVNEVKKIKYFRNKKNDKVFDEEKIFMIDDQDYDFDLEYFDESGDFQNNFSHLGNY